MKKTLLELIDKETEKYNRICSTTHIKNASEFALDYAVSNSLIRLMYLTIVTKEEQNLTDTIINLVKLLRPLVSKHDKQRYEWLTDVDWRYHNLMPHIGRYHSRVVGVVTLLDWLKHAKLNDKGVDMNKFIELYDVLYKEAQNVVDNHQEDLWKVENI